MSADQRCDSVGGPLHNMSIPAVKIDSLGVLEPQALLPLYAESYKSMKYR